MIYISNLHSDDVSVLPPGPAMERILQFIEEREYEKITEGEDYPLMGKDLFARIQHYDSMEEKDCLIEKHEVYIDVVYMVSGAERLGWCQTSPALKVVKPYDAEKDAAFYDKLLPPSYFDAEAGALFIFPTHVVHQPCMRIGKDPVAVEKVVFKVKKELLPII